MIATLQFSILAGEKAGDVLAYGRAASEELTADVSLTASILTMLYGLILLVGPRVFGYTNRVMRMISSIVAPGLSAFFICTASVDVAVGSLVGGSRNTGAAESRSCVETGFFSDTQHLQLLLPGIIMASVIILFWLLPSWRGKHLMQNWSNVLSASYPVASVALTCTAAAVGGLFNIYNPKSRLNEAQVWTVLGIVSAVFLLHAFITRCGVQVETEQTRSTLQAEETPHNEIRCALEGAAPKIGKTWVLIIRRPGRSTPDNPDSAYNPASRQRMANRRGR